MNPTNPWSALLGMTPEGDIDPTLTRLRFREKLLDEMWDNIDFSKAKRLSNPPHTHVSREGKAISIKSDANIPDEDNLENKQTE